MIFGKEIQKITSHRQDTSSNQPIKFFGVTMLLGDTKYVVSTSVMKMCGL